MLVLKLAYLPLERLNSGIAGSMLVLKLAYLPLELLNGGIAGKHGLRLREQVVLNRCQR
jgi:hypothetical protein